MHTKEPKSPRYWAAVGALLLVILLIVGYIGSVALEPFFERGDTVLLIFVMAVGGGFAVLLAVMVTGKYLVSRWAPARPLLCIPLALSCFAVSPAGFLIFLAGHHDAPTTYVWISGPAAGTTFTDDSSPLLIVVPLAVMAYSIITGVQLFRVGLAARPAALNATSSAPPDAGNGAAPRAANADGSMIRFRCQQCAKALKSPLHGAGRLTTCPGCGNSVQIPAFP